MSNVSVFGLDISHIAKVCHEANRAYCSVIGDSSQPSWEDAPDWQRVSAVQGIIFHIQNTHAGADASHKSWLAEKKLSGWKFGNVKDPEKKEHPCMVPFEELPPHQQAKDFLFRGIIHSFMDANVPITGVAKVVESPLFQESVRNAEMVYLITFIKDVRFAIDKSINSIKLLRNSREIALTHTSLQYAKSWLGIGLKEIGSPNPYTDSMNPESGHIEPQAEHSDETLLVEWKSLTNTIVGEDGSINQIAAIKYMRGAIDYLMNRVRLRIDRSPQDNDSRPFGYRHALLKSYEYLIEAKGWLGWELNQIKKELDGIKGYDGKASESKKSSN